MVTGFDERGLQPIHIPGKGRAGGRAKEVILCATCGTAGDGGDPRFLLFAVAARCGDGWGAPFLFSLAVVACVHSCGLAASPAVGSARVRVG